MIHKKREIGKSSKVQILFADNNSDFLDTRAEFLENEGFCILKAYSLEAAHRILNRGRVHLAILDLRLIDDRDEHDESGFLLAQNPTYRNIPKIILTGFPSTERVRDALRIQPDGTPTALDFLDKKDGPAAMVIAVKRIIKDHLKINWELRIFSDKQGPISFIHLASFLDLSMISSNLSELAFELEDLFRNLFSSFDQITLSRILWCKEHRVSLKVLACSEKRVHSYVVTCGNIEDIKAEQRIYEDIFPKVGETEATIKIMVAETQRFSATVWDFPQSNIEETLSFYDIYQRQSQKTIQKVLENLYQSTLNIWYQTELSVDHGRNVAQLFSEYVGFKTDVFQPEEFRHKMQILRNEAAILKLVNLSLLPGKLVFQLAEGEEVHCPDPIRYLYDLDLFIKFNFVCIKTPGIRDIDTILVDRDGRNWLTDFSKAKESPSWQDFVSLETIIRFELLDIYELFVLIDFEEQLFITKRLDENIRLGDVIPDCRKALSAIQTIRQLSAKIAGNNLLAYYIGLLFCSAQRLALYEPGMMYTKRETISFVHCLLFTAMLCKKISEIQDNSPEMNLPLAKEVLRIDEDKRDVRVGGRKVDLTPTEYNLLLYLFHNAGKICTRADLLRDVFEYPGAKPETSASLINTTIARLRDKIEPYPGKPIYIQTERGQGYILNLDTE
jgi:DNA-binding response OmpR family regulator